MDIAFAIFSLIGFIFFFDKMVNCQDDEAKATIFTKCVYVFGILLMLSCGFVIQNHGIDETEGEVKCASR